jgi:hypothetical protein
MFHELWNYSSIVSITLFIEISASGAYYILTKT